MRTFNVTYKLTLSDNESIEEKIESICLEQSVELPRAVISGKIASNVVGQCTSCEPICERIYRVIIRWPIDNIGGEITQFLNTLYGNISLKPGIKITSVEWEALPKDQFPGPGFGIKEIRKMFDLPARPLSATALKPMGSSADELGEICSQFARGGLDIIKDDHGLANQAYAPFEERLSACVEAVRRAADATGHRARYFPNITADGLTLYKRMEKAVELGADGVLVCPHLTGLAMLSELRRMDAGLPIIAHPAFSGALACRDDEGFSPDFLYGKLWRALGADFIIYPNTGGRFSFSKEQCRQINGAARTKELPFKRSFPMPGGGLKRKDINHWKNAYGPDTVFLMGGSLYAHPQGLEAAAHEFSSALMES